MLKEFIKHIQETTINRVVNDDHDNHFIIGNDGTYSQIEENLHYPGTLDLFSLDSLVKMVKNDIIPSPDDKIFITVPDVGTVKAFTRCRPDLRYERPVLYTVHAVDVPGWRSDEVMSFEDMQIALRTRFQDSADMPYVQKLLADITTGGKITCNDNGIATTVVTRKGVDLQAKEAIRPIVRLRPYRTFQEVEQPESPFLIRVSERGIRLISSDGGMWKLTARQTIKDFFEWKLKDEVDSGFVVVAL